MSDLIAEQYQIGTQIGEGAWSIVYQGLDTETDAVVAIKELREEIVALVPEALERFNREAMALRRLKHPHIVRIYDAVQEQETHYIILDYIEGGSLKTLLEQEAVLPLETVLRFSLQLADALNAAHHLSIIHRDLKPANILLTQTQEIRLTDFGVAHIVDMARVTKTGMPMGTMHYLAPEALNGQRVDVRVDVWALGVLMFQMLTGQLPFSGKRDARTMEAIIQQPVPEIRALRPDCPPAWQNLVEAMLRKERAARIATIHKVAMQLLALAHELGMDFG